MVNSQGSCISFIPNTVDDKTVIPNDEKKPASRKTKKQNRRPHDGSVTKAKSEQPINFVLQMASPSKEKTDQTKSGDSKKSETVKKKNTVKELMIQEVLLLLPPSYELYVYPPVNFGIVTIPDLVSPTPILKSFDVCYRFSFYMSSHYDVPTLDVERTTIFRGVPNYSIRGSIELDLLLKFFNQSTVRDYDTLVNSIAPLVIRGYTGELVCHDANLKAEAMAALYKLRYPNARQPLQKMMNLIAQYQPLAPGYYALGGFDGPDKGPGQTIVHFTTQRSLREQHYRLKCLDDKFAKVIPPYYAPCLTPGEILKAARKRLEPPERVTCTLLGKEWNELSVTELLLNTAARNIEKGEARWSSVSLLDHDEILAECKAHAKLKWGAKSSSVDEYMKGAAIAFMPADCAEFDEMCSKCIRIKSLEKQEVYDEAKVARFIMCPSVKARGFQHALLMNAQRRLFGMGDNRHPHSVKHMNERERQERLRDLFGTAEVANGDITSMESTVSPMHMEIEELYFTRLCAPDEVDKIRKLWYYYKFGKYQAYGKDYWMEMPNMRLSGCDHTSAGNFVVNHTWIFCIIYMLTGDYPADEFRLLVEGDDSIYTSVVPLENGHEYTIDPDDFVRAARALGTLQKLQVYPTYNQASFCGVNLRPCTSVVTGEPDDLITWDPVWILSRIFWSPDYDPVTNKHNNEYIYARVLSYLPRCLGDKETYEALLWAGKNYEPTKSVLKSEHFRHIVFKTFFRGDFDEIPAVSSGFERYCKKNGFPYYPVMVKPACLAERRDNFLPMNVVHVKRPEEPGFIQKMYSSISKVNEPFITEQDQGRCGYYAVWCYLRDHCDCKQDFETWYEERKLPFETISTEWLVFKRKNNSLMFTPKDDEGDIMDTDDDKFMGRVLKEGEYIKIADTRVGKGWMVSKGQLAEQTETDSSYVDDSDSETELSTTTTTTTVSTASDDDADDDEKPVPKLDQNGFRCTQLPISEVQAEDCIVLSEGHAQYRKYSTRPTEMREIGWDIRWSNPLSPLEMAGFHPDNRLGSPLASFMSLLVMCCSFATVVALWLICLWKNLVSIKGIPVSIVGNLLSLGAQSLGLSETFTAVAPRWVNILLTLIVIVYKIVKNWFYIVLFPACGLLAWKYPWVATGIIQFFIEYLATFIMFGKTYVCGVFGDRAEVWYYRLICLIGVVAPFVLYLLF